LIKAHRVWIEIVLLGAAIACALALLIASLGAAAGAAVDGFALQGENPVTIEQVHAQADQTPTKRTYVGMVTCSRCKAKHSAAMSQTADVCVRVCVHGGAHFALVNAETVYLLDGDLGELKKVAGQRVRILGDLNGSTIRVDSIMTQT
jgi:Zn ribbon nucleic-acid-binding protein